MKTEQAGTRRRVGQAAVTTHSPATADWPRGRSDQRKAPEEGRTQMGSMYYWARDTSPGQIARNERNSRKALSYVPGYHSFAAAQRSPRPLEGLLEPHSAAQERVWYVRETRHLARAHRRTSAQRGIQIRRYAVTVNPYRWMVETDRLHTDLIGEMLPKWRKEAQRWARKLGNDALVLGMIEASLNFDEKYGLSHWAFHLHLLVHVPCRSEHHGEALIKRAFPVKRNEALGAVSVFDCVPISPPGEARGWLRYLSKGLQVHAVQRRWVGYDEDRRERKWSQKRPLTTQELAPWAALVSHLKPEDLMIWVGWQRYGNRLAAKRHSRSS